LIARYREYSKLNENKERGAIDAELLSGTGRVPLHELFAILSEKRGDLETEMAVAVALGVVEDEEENNLAMGILVSLLCSKWERVRYRAAQSMLRLATFGLPASSGQVARGALTAAKDREKSAPVKEVLNRVIRVVGESSGPLFSYKL
jgi:hypothetical protein